MRTSVKFARVIDTDLRPFSPQAGPERKGAETTPALTPIGGAGSRSLAGATILQLVPSLGDNPIGHRRRRYRDVQPRRSERMNALRRVRGILSGNRIVLVLSRIVPSNGQMSVIDAARTVIGNGERNVVFAGEDISHPRYRRALHRRAAAHGIDTLCRFPGSCTDLPAAFTAADVVVVPSLVPPLTGRTAAQAQAMGWPVITTAVAALQEKLLCPPRMSQKLRTGWLVRPGHTADMARALRAALSLDGMAYAALGARAREFTEFMFPPQSVAEAMRGVYISLLACDG